MTVSYDGTDFSGWQIQPEQRTVQGELAIWLSRILGEEVQPTGASRTDSGVHAEGQVAHFDGLKEREPGDLEHHLNSALPHDLAVRDVESVTADFHARYSAMNKTYGYRILRRKDPLRWRYAWNLPRPLDVDRLHAACQLIQGTHDFAGFCVAKSVKDDSRCHIAAASWRQASDETEFTISGNRFMHGMVRLLVGTMVDIARGRWETDRVIEILETRDVRLCGSMAPAQGLTLLRVDYDHARGLGE